MNGHRQYGTVLLPNRSVRDTLVYSQMGPLPSTLQLGQCLRGMQLDAFSNSCFPFTGNGQVSRFPANVPEGLAVNGYSVIYCAGNLRGAEDRGEACYVFPYQDYDYELL